MSEASRVGSTPKPDAGPDNSPRAHVAAVSRGMTLFVMVVATLYFGQEVLVPITLALLLAFVLAPLVALLRRLHLGRVPSVLAGIILALGIVLAVGGVIGTQVAQLTGNLPEYAATVEAKVKAVRDYTVGRVSDLADRIGQRTDSGRAKNDQASPGAGGTVASPAPMPAAPTLPDAPIELAWHYLSPVLSPLATFAIVFIVAVFALLQQEDLRDRIIRLIGSGDLNRTTLAIDDGARRLSRYFVTQLSINASFGIVIGLGLLIIGVPNPVLWGILSALLRFVPYIGSLISALLPIALAAAVEPGWSMVLWTGALYLVIETLTGQAIEPLIYGHSTGLSPFSVVVAAIFWSWLWGPIGLILSTPLTLCLVVIGRHIPRLQFLDILLGDRAPLTPVESFYQRILAGDADEVQENAELLLKERSLSVYYDAVALKALQLAAADAQRGLLRHGQLERVKEAVEHLVRGLDDYDDEPPVSAKGGEAPGRSAIDPDGEEEFPAPVQRAAVQGATPAAWRKKGCVLCVAGRGPLDEAAAAMLVQLLDKHGVGGRLVRYGEASRETIRNLDTDGVAMACISYLDLAGSPAHLRYLMRRLRQHLPPGTPILVGLWPATDPVMTDTTQQATIGADYFTSSLQEAVAACRTEAAKKPVRAKKPRAAPSGTA